MNTGSTMKGIIIRYKKGHYLRIWRYGYEWAWPGGGKINFFPWTKQYRKLKAQKEITKT